jgi:HTH-type transcriptional regulator / antitoxin HigA
MTTTTNTAAPERGAFTPDYAVPPGATLAEWLDVRQMTQADLAVRVGLSTKAVNQIVRGHVPLSQKVALRLESVTGVPARTWNALEAVYREDVVRLQANADLVEQVDFLAEMPVSQLRKLGVLTAPARDKVGTLVELLRFFGVADVQAWRALWQSPQAVFRQSTAFVSQPGAVAAWLRMGELAALDEPADAFDALDLRAALPVLRDLTRAGDPQVFVPALKRICAEAGVVVVLVPEVTGARCSGATRWLRGRPVVQLSLRYRTDDQLWFSLFHELGHVLLHPRSEVFIDAAVDADDEPAVGRPGLEHEANTFASDLLIPPAEAAELSAVRTLVAVREFAERLGIADGIVVGRLQHDQIVPYSFGNRLKRRFAFAPDR